MISTKFQRKIFSSDTTKNFSENFFRNIFRENSFRHAVPKFFREKNFSPEILEKYFEKSFRKNFSLFQTKIFFAKIFSKSFFRKFIVFSRFFAKIFVKNCFFLWIVFCFIKYILKMFKNQFIFIESGVPGKSITLYFYG